MGTLYIQEYTSTGRDANGKELPFPAEPPVARQTVTTSATAAQSSAFNAATKFVRIVGSGAVALEFGPDPTAVVTDTWVPATTPEFFSVRGGDKLSVIDA